MSIDTQLVPPKMLGVWVRILRHASQLSQDALAVASGLTVRTVQRVEAGERASVTTRRCLARGLGYDNLDIFDDPNFVSTVTHLFTSLHAAQVAEKGRYADHIKLAVEPVSTGTAFAALIGQIDAWVVHCDEAASPEAQQEAATLFDLGQDYGDIWQEISHSARVDAQSTFGDALESLYRRGMRVYQAKRPTQLLGPPGGTKTPVRFVIGYVTVVSEDQELSHILVPKQMEGA
jgi:transcriptional regulator with XRE-family HTH domain